MQQFKHWPTVLQRRWLLSWAAGAAFLVIGIAMFFALEDQVLLVISILLAVCIILRCFAFYRIVVAGNYEVVSGICIGLGRAGWKKYRTIRLLLTDGTKCEITLDKRISLRIGNCYQFYFRTAPGTSETAQLPSRHLMDSSFLALSDLGEYHLDENSQDSLQKTAVS